MEIILVGAIILFILIYNNTIDKNKFFADNEKYLEAIREEDYTFLVYARYGEEADADQLYMKRVTYAIIAFFMILALTMSGGSSLDFINSQFFLNLVLSAFVAFLMFKMPYTQLKGYYKANLHKINLMLPYYLKSLEILIQHYTVPVALAKSIETAPDIFKPGLKTLVAKIEAGDMSVDPYMDFAKEYPVRDSMRMMRLLYRLGLGSQENKQEQLMMFARTVSTLQNKSREQKYKERLEKMENKTMVMLACTGGGTLLLLLASMMMMMNV